ncbi:hypothetical protein A3Q29_21440 [Providencia stuartii]|uniref:Relaxosome protein TraM n=1 Tax=Providencia stuartii TaxID=588 RepID=A0A1S1HRT7_PROST|nr:hypothetical protein A3Q29_21440 [Providencia stuartii]
MARQNVYMPQKIYDAIKSIVEERRAEGASSSDANMSSVCSEMLDIGVRVTMNLKKKSEDLNDDGMSWEDLYQRQILEEVSKARQCSQKIFQMLFDLQEIKADSRYDFRETVNDMKTETERLIDQYFDSNDK